MQDHCGMRSQCHARVKVENGDHAHEEAGGPSSRALSTLTVVRYLEGLPTKHQFIYC
jgi:hypothetical protein